MDFVIGFLVVFSLMLGYYAYDRRQSRLLREENEVRERLGLPSLTRSDFSVNVVEKSADYRGNVNQHM